MNLKYIMLETEAEGQKVRIPVIFSPILVHKDVAEAIIRIRGFREAFKAEPVSAGEIQLHVEACFGKSETLNLQSKGEEDRELISLLPILHGLVPD